MADIAIGHNESIKNKIFKAVKSRNSTKTPVKRLGKKQSKKEDYPFIEHVCCLIWSIHVPPGRGIPSYQWSIHISPGRAIPKYQCSVHDLLGRGIPRYQWSINGETIPIC